jgi:hypothetical protein
LNDTGMAGDGIRTRMSIIQNLALERASEAGYNILKTFHDTPHAVIKKQRLAWEI